MSQLSGLRRGGARSLDDLLTLPQYRTLVVLHSAGTLSTTALAEQVGVHQSTATR